MKPLVLREIADELGLHESTISRVTTRQVHAHARRAPSSSSISSAAHLNTDAGGNASSTAVRALIKQLVAAENAGEALVRQQAIAELLERAGHPGRAPHRREVP
jgi:RNA polymerase sigma-54 factor